MMSEAAAEEWIALHRARSVVAEREQVSMDVVVAKAKRSGQQLAAGTWQRRVDQA
jgi:hypothetical protein